MATIDDVCDYIILRCSSAGLPLNVLKLQKLLYYSQAWNLAFTHQRLFEGRFQAWVHGPVNREIYDRFVDSKYLYSDVASTDVKSTDPQIRLTDRDKVLVESVIESYAKYSGTELEMMTHREKPWIDARGGIPELERCEVEIDEDTMRSFYADRIKTK